MRDSEFGRAIFRQRMGGMLLIAGLGALPIGVILSLSPLADPAVQTWIGPGIAICGALALPAGILRRSRVVVVYENGIVDGDTRLALSDVDEFSVVLALLTISGIRAGTEYQVQITGQSNMGITTLRFSSGNLGHDTSRIDEMIGRISQCVEEKMVQTLRRGGSVDWGKRWRISRHGLSTDTDPPIEFSDIAAYSVDNGFLAIATSARRKLRMSTNEANFFPGYLLMQRLVNENTRESIL